MRYEIRIAGRLDDAAAAATFGGLDVSPCGGVTVIRGELDQAGLHGVLERIRSLHLELVDARRARTFPSLDPARWRESLPSEGGPDGNACLRD
jgi:hypothetical protein